MADIVGLRVHAAIDSGVSDEEVAGCLHAAMGYLEMADVKAPSDGERAAKPLAASLYDRAAYMVATYYYEKRGMLGDAPSADALGVQGIIHQLRDVFKGEA